jgi:tryptophan-rich sensory protein
MLERSGTIKSPILRDDGATERMDFRHHPVDAARAGVERLVAAGSLGPMLGRAAVLAAIERGLSTTRRIGHDAERALRRAGFLQYNGLLHPAQAVVCAIAAVLAMEAINYAGTHSNLQWAYAYMPALLQNFLQPRAAWYNVLGAAKARLGSMVSNDMWLRSLAKPTWGASPEVHRIVWFGVELAIGFAMFRLLTSPRAKATPKSAKIAAGFMLVACAVRTAVWGFALLGLRSLPLGVFHYTTYVALLAAAAFKARKMDKVAGRALMAANVWVAYTCAQCIAMLVMNRA